MEKKEQPTFDEITDSIRKTLMAAFMFDMGEIDEPVYPEDNEEVK